MNKTYFTSPEESHQHSLQTLNQLYAYDDFMESITTVADMGCGRGLDIEWWATRTTRDERADPLNIKCYGIDQFEQFPMTKKYRNTQYHRQDFEEPITVDKTKFDVIWSHDSFQYVINPFQTLVNWKKAMHPNATLAIVLPQTTNIEFNTQAFDQLDFQYYNWTMVSLIHTLAVSGFDCRDGYFLKHPDSPWLHAIVYNSDQSPRNPRTTTWYELAEAKLLPVTAVDSINKYGYVKQRDLTLPWVNKALTWLGKE